MERSTETPDSTSPPAGPAAVTAGKPPAPKKEAKKTVAKKSSKQPAAGKDVNKSEEIRKLARELQAKGEPVRPVTIVTALKKRGIIIAPPQASMVLKAMGFKSRKRAAARAAGQESKKVGKTHLSVDDLVKAKKAVESFGGARKLIDAVSALVELQ